MLYTARKEFHYDPAVFKIMDTQIALRIQDEFVTKHSARPYPHFFEVDRAPENVDSLWHFPKGGRTKISRELEIPAINYFQRPSWKLTQIGQVPQRRDIFWLSNAGLEKVNYFPSRGDMVWWNGYRYMMINVVIPPEAYWQQTGVWLGLTVECEIIPEGDARPLANPAVTVPSEQSPSTIVT